MIYFGRWLRCLHTHILTRSRYGITADDVMLCCIGVLCSVAIRAWRVSSSLQKCSGWLAYLKIVSWLNSIPRMSNLSWARGCFGVSWCLIDLPVNGKYAVSRVIDLFRFCVEAARGPARDGRSRVLRFMWSVRGSQFLLPFRLKGCV